MKEEFCHSKQMRIMGALTFLMVIIALGSYASLNFENIKFANPTPATISVSGEGEFLAIPDIGQFSFSVTAEDAVAATAQELSGTKINAILAYLKEQGIAEKDIKTQNYSLSPKYRWDAEVCPIGSYCPGKQVQDGFTVSQTVAVKVRDTSKAGALIAGIGDKGATDISNLNFTVDDIEGVKAEARTKAITDAKAKAEVLAKQLGVRVVRMTSYFEDQNGPVPYFAKTMSADAAVGFSGPELPVGEASTKVSVTVTYQVE